MAWATQNSGKLGSCLTWLWLAVLPSQLAGPIDLGQMCPLGARFLGWALAVLEWEWVIPSLTCVFCGGSEGTNGQVRRSYSPGLLLCGQQGLVLTLAAAAGWAAICNGTHMADAAGQRTHG